MENSFIWITDGGDKPFYARKIIQVPHQVQTAMLMVCGLGQFEFYINGRKTGDHELDPGWTKYNKYIEYVTFDVTEELSVGENVLAAQVGNGWYIMNRDHYSFHFPPFMPPNPNPYKPFGSCLVLWAKLIVTYKDSTGDVWQTDDTWRTSACAVTSSNVYGSETIDGRLRQAGWNDTGFDDSTWQKAKIAGDTDQPKARMVKQFQPPVKVIRSYDAVYLHSIGQRRIYDFTQNMSGMMEIELKGKKGDIVRIYTAEKLKDDGDVDQMAKGWVMVDNCNTYILGKDDEWEKFRMTFTYFAGRYAAVEGDAKVRNFKADYITSAWEDSGSFECDDQRFMEIYHLVKSSVEANMLSVHTDCPTIERFAWQEPNHLMAPSIMYMKNGRKLWEKFLMDMRMEQITEDDVFKDHEGNDFYPGVGLMPSQAPCYIPNVLPVPDMGSFYDIIPWGSTCIIGTYWHYLFYGDEKIIIDNYEAGMRYLDHLKTKINEDGFIAHGLGDWGNPAGQFARENIETAFLYADAMILSKFADKLGRGKDKAALIEFAGQVKENYNAKLMVRHPTEGFWCYKAWENREDIVLTQACEAIPLYWGLVPEHRKEDVQKAFKYVMQRDQTFACGEVGQPYVIQTMRDLGMNDMICRFILKEEHPSYYAFVLAGETSLGEYWEDNPRSHNHDMMGHIVEWYYNGIAGILILEPGAKKVMIRPYLPKSMTWFKCSFDSAGGKITVDVNETEEDIKVHITCPNGVVYSFDDSLLSAGGKPVVLK